jgi:hypothetical protein
MERDLQALSRQHAQGRENAMTTDTDKPWKPEVIADSDGKWSRNRLTFATAREALDWASDLARRWTPVTAYRAHNVATDEVFGETTL